MPQFQVEYPLIMGPGRRLAVALILTFAIASSAIAFSFGALVASLGFGGLAFAIIVGWRLFGVRQRVAFSDVSVHIPQTRWSANTVEVPFAELEAVVLIPTNISVTLMLPDRKFRIYRSWLSSDQAFADVKRRLVQGVAQAFIEKHGEGD